jgi:hypothetical protein
MFYRCRRPRAQHMGARKIFTDKQIRRAPDCVSIGHRHICCLVTLSPQVTLSDSDKLDALRRLDQFREWRSLDDTRFCLVCGKIINGRQIQVDSGTRGDAPPRLNCPSERCNSIPMDWVLPTDEILALAETMASEKERNVSPPGAADHSVEEHGLTSQLKKLAMQFKLAF